MGEQWQNWAGSVQCTPTRILRPASEEELCQGVRDAARDGLCVRVAGTGHSFMPIVPTDGVLIALDELAGLESSDPDACEATVWAGTKIHDLGDPLLELGLALENQGDVDVQALGGALGTGTHGTGRMLRNLSSYPRALRLVTATGELLDCSEEDDPGLLQAARVSLGLLGVISAARLRLVPAYRLHERIWRSDTDRCLEELEEQIANNRHFEFFWYPSLDRCEMKTLNPTEAAPDDLPDVEGERIGWSCHIISSVRELKFHEMEYSVPAEHGPACFQALRTRIRERHPEVVWPVEYRSLAADDAWLSPAYERDTVTLSVHQDGRLPFEDFFADVEPILAGVGGRPHWGKVHTLGQRELRERYPRFDAFCERRQQLDPKGRFLNDHLREIFAL